MKNLQNYPTIIILCILSSLYWSASMDLEFHYLAIRYKPYLFTVESIINFLVRGMGAYLIISAAWARNYQVKWSANQESDLPLNILMIELVAFILVGMDMQFIQISLKRFYSQTIIIYLVLEKT